MAESKKGSTYILFIHKTDDTVEQKSFKNYFDLEFEMEYQEKQPDVKFCFWE